MVQVLKTRFLNYYNQHEVAISIGVFVFGFLFDLLTLGRIDDLLNLIQQAIYLIILGSLLICEIKVKMGTLVLSERMQKWWEYHSLVVHFLFGSLLSVYVIFYYTSASAFTSFFFILLLAGLMCANEFPKIQKIGLPVRVILFSICTLSYFAFFYPILMGHVGAIPFWLGFLSSATVLGIAFKLNFSEENSEVLKKNVLYPAIGIHLFFILGYYFSLIPPVPVAVKRIGIYYEVIKQDGDYIGKHQRPFWKFWAKGSQDFQARPGDKVSVLLSIFSPAHFADQVYLKWFLDTKDGWSLQDTIPLSITGGRDDGFRGFATKQFFTAGDWRVVVETSDGREVGRISLEITPDNSTEPREFKLERF